MGMTATQLGTIFGRGAAAMNVLLKEHGFLEGGPGAWMPTELGKQFAQAHDFDNGYGGYAHRSWGWLSWSDGLIDALRSSIEENPDGIAVAVPTSVAKVAQAATNGSTGRASGRTRWVALAAVGVVAVSAPAAKNAWTRIARRKSAVDGAALAAPTPLDAAAPAGSAEDSATVAEPTE